MKTKQFTLVWFYNGKPFPIITGGVGICQKEKKRIKGQPQYKGGKMILRTQEGFLANPNYIGKSHVQTLNK